MKQISQTPTPFLDRLFPALDPGEFLDRYWPNNLLVHHGELGRLERLHDLPELKDVSTLLQIVKGDVRVITDDRREQTEQSYDEIHVDPCQALPLYGAGLSVCLTSIDRWVPGVAAWVDQLAVELGIPRDLTKCNSYASRVGTGLAKHWDAHEVVIVQLRGSKNWRIAENEDVSWPSVNYVPAASFPAGLRSYCPRPLPETMPASSTDVLMRPGSVLFLPRGVWHATEATDEDSLSLTFSLAPPSWKDLVVEAIGRRLERSARWRERAAGLWAGTERTRQARERFSELLDGLSEEFASLSVDELGNEERRLWQCKEGVEIDAGVSSGPDDTIVRIMLPQHETLEIKTEAEWLDAFRWLGQRQTPFRVYDLARSVPDIGLQASKEILAALEEARVLEHSR